MSHEFMSVTIANLNIFDRESFISIHKQPEIIVLMILQLEIFYNIYSTYFMQNENNQKASHKSFALFSQNLQKNQKTMIFHTKAKQPSNLPYIKQHKQQKSTIYGQGIKLKIKNNYIQINQNRYQYNQNKSKRNIIPDIKINKSQSFNNFNDQSLSTIQHQRNDKTFARSRFQKSIQSEPRKLNKISSLRKQRSGQKSEKLLNKGKSTSLIRKLRTSNNQQNEQALSISQSKSKQKLTYNFSFSKQHFQKKNNQQKEQNLLNSIRSNIIGFNTSFISGVNLPVEALYADHTATNRPYKAIQVLVEHAKLFSANPHSQHSGYGKFSTQLMNYSINSLLSSFSCSRDQYIVLPIGAGSTGAIEKAIRILKRIESLQFKWKSPAVFLTPYQHHSNILPWIQYYQKVSLLSHSSDDTLLMENIVQQLSECKSQSMIISVSAASNVTSKITDLVTLNHAIKYLRQKTSKNIIFCVDCAAFCNHRELNISIYDQIDFAFLSPHKNLGGTQSCGVFVARKSLLVYSKPTFPGGGTVRLVKGYSKSDVMYETDIFSKQTPGTPPYLGFYRAALSFQLLKNQIGYEFIHKKQVQNTQLFFKLIKQANIKLKSQSIASFINIYGDLNLNTRANVVSFNIQYENSKYVHHHLVNVILNDIFGIQIRSGCFCSGPYSINLLKIKQQKVNQIQKQMQGGKIINKPGYLRLDLSFYLEQFQVQYIVKAIILISKYHTNFLKLYTVNDAGQVVPIPIFSNKNKNIQQIYSLDKSNKAFEILQNEYSNNILKLKNRSQTLDKQIKVGQFIAKNPIKFIKKIEKGQNIYDILS